MAIIVKRLAEPNLSEPILIGGVPDSGYVTKLIVDHMIGELEPRPFVEIYSSHFAPRITVNPDGTSHLPRNVLYYHKGSSRDLLLFTADAQPVAPAGAFEISEAVLDVGSAFGTKLVYAIGAGVTSHYSKPRVFGVGTDEEMVKELEELGAEPMRQGLVTWMNGVLVGLAKLRGMRGAFLCVYCRESEAGYSSDAKSAELLLETLSKITGERIVPGDLPTRVKESWFQIHDEARQEGQQKGQRPVGPYG